MKEENLHIKIIEKLAKKKFEYWKEEFVRKLKEEINGLAKDMIDFPLLKIKDGKTTTFKEIIDKLAEEEIKGENSQESKVIQVGNQKANSDLITPDTKIKGENK